MFAKAILATDLSPASDRIVSCISCLKGLGVREIVLTHALGIRHLDDMRYELLRMLEPHLERQREELEKAGFAACIRAPRGMPVEELVRVTREQDAEIVIMGSVGHSLAHDVLLGSTVLQFIHHSPVPVLILRVHPSSEGGEPFCVDSPPDLGSHILYATDFSDNAEFAYQTVKHLVAEGARRVTLLHVQDIAHLGRATKEQLSEFDRIDQERLERRKAELATLGKAEIDIVVLHGHATEEILKHSREGVSLIVLGSQGRGYFRDVFLGSTSHNVARHATVPVLLVPHPR